MMHQMKNIFRVSILLLAAVSMHSCEDLGNLTNKTFAFVDTDYYDLDFNVDPTDDAGFQIFTEEFITGDITNVLEEAGFSSDKVESIHIYEALVNLREVDTYKDFDLLKFVELTVYTDDQGETKVAWSDPVPENKISLTLDISDSNILSYFKEDQFILTAQGFLKERINSEMKLHAKVKFRVKVNID